MKQMDEIKRELDKLDGRRPAKIENEESDGKNWLLNFGIW